MLRTITLEIRGKLGEIGLEEDEIGTIQMVHELKTRAYPIDMKKRINQAAFRNLSKGIAGTFENNRWSEEDFFEIVEKCRDEPESRSE
ncbi:MAG: hypothetical protein BECKG1743D_GA0114223_110841 [Candidatus Kentron sp. G]|nr:MAG: hypothetical protein BECKG1743F_GA0114225_111061 [Candidatus Kentron sp. G]VFN06800.1 MAG: hypothetical protein BECKG1743E_GA0114224_110711 [Candidatus Kentron sp. G]VFN07515.1 MAG: hypothetical protein BECKG1743D_GA0114223_110841 [Candidatus Kentron sp. G]